MLYSQLLYIEIYIKCLLDLINENITIDYITRKTRIQKISDIRKAIVLLSEKYCNASNKILVQKLNISSSMISKIKSGDSKATDYVKEVIERWEGISK